MNEETNLWFVLILSSFLGFKMRFFFQKSSSFYTVNDNFSFCLVYMVVYQVERIFVVYFIDDEAFN